MGTKKITDKEYKDYFKNKESEALKHALDIRKFEIELYWKRATYFWTFIGATMLGFIAVQTSEEPNKQNLSIILACLGSVFSLGWVCVNKGSKYWQENWENHVDMLEDKVTGPLYKVFLSKKEGGFKSKIINLLIGPAKISVSAVNQIISLYVFLVWIFCCSTHCPNLNGQKY